MSRAGVAVLIASLAGVVGCEPPPQDASTASTSGGEPNARANGGQSGRSLSEILGPPGARLSRERLLEIAAIIRRVERNPYQQIPESRGERNSTPFLLLAWLTASQDVHVVTCSFAPLAPAAEQETVGGHLTLGGALGMAAYLIEHPEAPSHSDEVQVAGLASGLL